MTDHDTEKAATTTSPTADALESAETSESTDAPEPEDEKDEDDDDDKKSKKSKKKKKKDKDKDEDDGDKPKKLEIEFESTMPRNEAISYFEAIIGGLRSGRLEFKQGDKHLILNPPENLEIEVKAQSKGDKGKVVFEIEWSDESRPLEISN